MMTDDNEMPLKLKTAFFIYEKAFENIKDIKFIIELLNITKEYDNIEKLQKKIIWYVYAHINIINIINLSNKILCSGLKLKAQSIIVAI